MACTQSSPIHKQWQECTCVVEEPTNLIQESAMAKDGQHRRMCFPQPKKDCASLVLALVG